VYWSDCFFLILILKPYSPHFLFPINNLLTVAIFPVSIVVIVPCLITVRISVIIKKLNYFIDNRRCKNFTFFYFFIFFLFLSLYLLSRSLISVFYIFFSTKKDFSSPLFAHSMSLTFYHSVFLSFSLSLLIYSFSFIYLFLSFSLYLSHHFFFPCFSIPSFVLSLCLPLSLFYQLFISFSISVYTLHSLSLSVQILLFCFVDATLFSNAASWS